MQYRSFPGEHYYYDLLFSLQAGRDIYGKIRFRLTASQTFKETK